MQWYIQYPLAENRRRFTVSRTLLLISELDRVKVQGSSPVSLRDMYIVKNQE